MEQKLIKAPIDGKNISTDWIDCIFDGGNFCWTSGKYVGFIKDVPVICEYWSNIINWELFGDEKIPEALAELKKRLNQFDESDNEHLVIKNLEYRMGDDDEPLRGITQFFFFIVD